MLQVYSSKEISDTGKITQLREIEAAHYKPLIQQLAYKKTQEELKDLAIILKDIGYLTTKLGELSEELKYYTDAAVFYQYVIAILDEKLSVQNKNEFTKQEMVYPYKQLTDIQELIFSAIGGDKNKMPVVREEATSNKLPLSKLRLRADLDMEMIEKNYRQQVNADNQEEKQKYQELYVKTARELFEDTANIMQKFLAQLYSDSEKELTISPPCKYAVIGLGSMALKQMTPYSDLEFAILTENEDYKQNDDPKIRAYFKNLSHLVNFKMINLGETIIPTSKYGLDMSHIVHRAVNFDLGGKTPLGRIENDKPYELIKTIDGMLYYVRNKGEKTSHIDKNLPHILEKVCYVHGDEQLFKSYQEKVIEFLHSKNEDDLQGRLNCEIRAIKLLKEGAVEINYLKHTPNLKPTKGNLDELQPNLFGDAGKLFDVKQEIYRLPDRMVYNLGLYYGIEGDSAWDIIDKLENQGIITSEATINLKNAITFATTLRLKTYLHHKAQTEDMSIFTKPAETESELEPQTIQMFHLSKEDLGEQGRLFQYFYTALPLHEKLKNFCEQYQILSNEDKQTFFRGNKFYTDDSINKGLIHYRLAQYKDARNNFEITLANPDNRDNLQVRLMLGIIYSNFGNGDKAIEQFQYCLSVSKCVYKTEIHFVVAMCLNNIGLAYHTKGQYEQAIKYLEDSLKLKELINKGEPNKDVAYSLGNLGVVYSRKGQLDKAVEYLTKSFDIMQYLNKGKLHPDIAYSLSILGLVYIHKGQHDKAIECFTKSCNMKQLLYQNEPHPDIAVSLNNLAVIYELKGNYGHAIYCYTESLKILKRLYEISHPDIATLLNNLAVVYKHKGQYDEAIEYIAKSVNMRQQLYKDEFHPYVVGSFNNLWNIYNTKAQHEQPVKYYTIALEMMQTAVEDSLNNLGIVHNHTECDDQVTRYYTKALKIMELTYEASHPDIAASLHNLWHVYWYKGQHELTIEYPANSLKIMELIYNEPNPDVVASLNSLCNVYRGKNQYEQGIEYYTRSLELMARLYKGKVHPNIIFCWNKLALYYSKLGDTQKELNCLEQASKMVKVLFRQDNSDIQYVDESSNNTAMLGNYPEFSEEIL
ncbi:tetratricopeptide repeat protein [Candidatus Tisiphia endosymbiont of Hybos culiciformis]|uniref:tetratricopeptide repeat protein n=1 Tax=Candidatus Tisiphia endosymbiont of Hybos culiciformis TaxID=3139331 RepID=UPI003CCA7D9A